MQESGAAEVSRRHKIDVRRIRGRRDGGRRGNFDRQRRVGIEPPVGGQVEQVERGDEAVRVGAGQLNRDRRRVFRARRHRDIGLRHDVDAAVVGADERDRHHLRDDRAARIANGNEILLDAGLACGKEVDGAIVDRELPDQPVAARPVIVMIMSVAVTASMIMMTVSRPVAAAIAIAIVIVGESEAEGAEIARALRREGRGMMIAAIGVREFDFAG